MPLMLVLTQVDKGCPGILLSLKNVQEEEGASQVGGGVVGPLTPPPHSYESLGLPFANYLFSLGSDDESEQGTCGLAF